ncbi:DUF4136 domain-containing protein [Arenibacter sp. GZD96]|uniref:DUF4136 domain-containing protein n=1 Tax=Aurantibrevibacter litoralis TaxID=3106030 RepID=UPI002AFEAD42|nr:DUF4136 domain-containing protein [Arenibacter sp. GZD-96]MEA1785793.1 DUF4136 domain-containing protein [Arenibacter sp. GZD-96]
MKKLKILAAPLLLLFLLTSCGSSVRVLADYDKEANFNNFKTYAFFKTGIDKAQISDLDKKRILSAIESEMEARGFIKSNDPDILVSIFTKERERVDVYNNYWGGGFYGPGFFGGGFYGRGLYGFGYNPWLWGGPFGYGGNAVSTSTEGSLYIDLIDARRKELVWQGRGVGTLNNIKKVEKKEERIKEFVSEILQAYPPVVIAAIN